MKQELKAKKDLNIIVCTILGVIIVLLTIGYAAFDQELTISGEGVMQVEKDVRIQSANFSEALYGQENSNLSYTKDTLTTDISLLQLDGTISYVLTLRNLGNVNMNLISSSFINSNNENITYTISEQYPVLIPSGVSNKQITITFMYKDSVSQLPANTNLVSTIKFNFSSSVCTSNTIKQTYSVGDVVAICNTTTGRSEDFYVLNDDGTNLTALAKYRLYVGNTYKYNSTTQDTSDVSIDSQDEQYGLQSLKTTIVSEDGYDVSVAYANFLNDSPYWIENNELKSSYGNSYPAFVYDNNSNIYTYLQNYQTYLSTLTNDNTITTSLISLDTLVNLGCTDSSCITQTVAENNRLWLYNTGAYWTGNAYDNSNIYHVGHDGLISYDMSVKSGIRPVITIAKTNIK